MRFNNDRHVFISGTTISTLKFPILNPKPWRLAMREKRIKIDKTTLQEERILQKSMVQQEEHLRSKWKSATLSGMTFIQGLQYSLFTGGTII